MKEVFTPEPYQVFGINHLISNPKAALFLDMGLGKTVVTLTAIAHLMRYGCIRKVLIIGPKNVSRSVWPMEAEKWQHLDGMRVERIIGTEKQRIKVLMDMNLREPAHVYTINRELIPWLVAYYGGSVMPFDMYVVDESTSFKNSDAVRFKALSAVMPSAARGIVATGTPTPNGMVDLWAQIFLLDGGLRLEPTKGKYLAKYFYQEHIRGTERSKSVVIPGAQNLINDRIKDIAISMDAKDLIKLPPVSLIDYPIELPEALMQKYKKFKKDKVLELAESIRSMMQNGDVDLSKFITAKNAISLSTKLIQFTSGAIYNDDKVDNSDYVVIHNEKIDALEEIIEMSEGGVLVACNYQHEYDRIASALKKYKPVRYKTEKDMIDWNAGKIKVMYSHAKSLGHGSNLQFGGHTIVWMSNNFDLELYTQFNQRLPRRGQVNRVNIYRLVCKGTEDVRVCQVLDQKGSDQQEFINAMKQDVMDILSGHVL